MLDYIYFRFTTLNDKQTPGLKLLIFKFRFTSKVQRMNLLLLKVILPYLYERFRDFIERYDWSKMSNRKGDIKSKLKYWCAFIVKFLGKL